MVESTENKYPYPEFMQVKYTEYNPLNLKVMEGLKEINLMTYRYAVPDGIERKGVAFFIHGFGDYCEHFAYFFKKLADEGYECFAFDQRGCGNSEGLQAFFGSPSIQHSDIQAFMNAVVLKYELDRQQVPLFLIGMSFGGLLSFNQTIQHPEMFKGVALLVPFFAPKAKGFKYVAWVFQTISYFSPHLSMKKKRPYSEEYKKRYAFIFNDPKRASIFRFSQLAVFKHQLDYAWKHFENAKSTPIVFITGSDDIVVSSQATEEMHKKLGNDMNRYVDIQNCDHTQILFEEEHNNTMIKEVIEFFDGILRNQ